MRRRMIDIIRAKGITDEKVLAAMERVPRHLFLDAAFLEYAYQDTAFKIGAGQTISQPYTVAFQTQLLQVSKGDKVLEIGTGSGYQTSVLLELGAKVFSVERQKLLFDKAKALLHDLGYSPKLYYGDGYKGLPSWAPFKRILVTAGAPYVPNDLLDQLDVGGIMVIPVGENEVQVMTKIIKLAPEKFEKEEMGQFRFVPLLQEKENHRN